MKLEASLEVINNLASHKGYKKVPASFCQLSFAKDPNAGKYFLIVNSTKKPSADKYRVPFFLVIMCFSFTIFY
jgi:hypothetical protein